MKKIIITGATGQDGSYMAEYLLANTKDTIICAIRRTSQAILSNLKNVLDNPRVKLVTLDLCDGQAIRNLIREEKPDYFINFGAQTFVADSWQHPVSHMQTNAMALIHILEAVREYNPTCRVYSSGSSEELGDVVYSPQDEKHPLRPRSPYGVAKASARLLCKVYRESYGLYVVHGTLFNHESERRQDYFVTRKIAKGVARIAKAIKDGKIPEPIELGNLDAKRDWSHAEDFVDGVWRMLNQENYRKDQLYKTDYLPPHPSWLKEYILSSNETHTVREFVERAFAVAGFEGCFWDREEPAALRGHLETYEWINKKTNTGHSLVRINPAFYRPAEVDILHGDSSAVRKDLGWSPKVSFEQLVERMVKNELTELDIRL